MVCRWHVVSNEALDHLGKVGDAVLKVLDDGVAVKVEIGTLPSRWLVLGGIQTGDVY